MSENFVLGAGHIVGEIDVLPNAVSGTGSAEGPIIVVPLMALLRCPNSPRFSLDFREVRCRVSPFDRTYIAESRPVWIDLRVESGQNLPNQQILLEIPFDRFRLALIERLRGGGDVRLRFDLELQVDELVEIAREKQMPNPSVWGLKAHHRLHAQLTTVIPRSVWLERVLPQTEFARVHIIELPAVPIDGIAPIKRAYDALCQAQKLEKEGHYNDAVGNCRIALECFCEPVEKQANGQRIKVLMLKSSWQTRLGKATYDWLNACFAAMKQPTNQPHHPSSSGFDRLEAQMLLMITTALVAYAVQTQPTSVA